MTNLEFLVFFCFYIFLIFYLIVLFYGSISSLTYTIETNQRLFTAWAPYVWPIKSLMLIGILLMLLQAFSMLFKDIAKIKGKKIYKSPIDDSNIDFKFNIARRSDLIGEYVGHTAIKTQKVF